MTQSSLQTQCPNCQTRFRVTEEQLGIAKGKVRCGNCMKVFNAIEHQVIPGGGEKPRTPATPAQPAGASSPAGSTSGSGVSEEDFVFADNPEEDAAEGPYAGTKLTFSDDELSDSFRSFDERDETDYKDADTDGPDEQVDESWAEAILQDDEPASRKPSAPQRPEPAPEPEPEDTSPEPEPRPAPRPELSLEEEPVFEQTGTLSSAATGPAKDSDPFDDFVDESGFDFDEPERPADAFHADPPFRDLRREPVAVDSGGSGVRTIVWSVIVLGLIGVLIAQVTWFQFDRLSAIPEDRKSVV